ncbi:MAG: hypothetical protein H0U15_10155 [Geodermatophilaceae bacterium]|nr:hypothetical protein [Geodermatophilaceae bacterium]
MRAWVAAGITVPLSTVLIVGIVLLTDRLPGILTRSLLSWNLFGLVYAALTVFAFRKVDPSDHRRHAPHRRRPLCADVSFNTIIIALLVTALSR